LFLVLQFSILVFVLLLIAFILAYNKR